MIETKGIVLARLGALPTLEPVVIHPPGPDEVLVRIKAAGICHTDLGYMHDLVTDLYQGDHAAVGETPLLWALRPELVRPADLPPDQSLPGIIGADPRGGASAAWGRELCDAIVERTARWLLRVHAHFSAQDRIDYIEALRATIRVLEKTAQ